MRRTDWLRGLRSLYSPRVESRGRQQAKGSRRRASFEVLEDRRLLAVDFGDAPDLGVGTAAGNYNTLSSDNGPQHTIVVGLRMGASVDGDSGLLQNAAANADDVNAALPDDEDGLVIPNSDLSLTVGSQPTVSMWVTNTTGAQATLYGWIDYNADGVFDNATERASVVVASGTSSQVAMLEFPAVPTGSEGSTYARFRLSTDAAAANPTGAASDGEVEDYRVSITATSTTTVDPSKTKKLASGTINLQPLANSDRFGASAATLGDLDGDGIIDAAIGMPGDNTGGADRGAIQVLLFNSDGTIKSSTKIAHNTNGGPTLADGDGFGASITAVGDLDGDGVVDLAAGADRDDSGGVDRGAVHLLFMNPNGTVKSLQKIAHNFAGGPTLADSDWFGGSLSSIGDMNGDGVPDLAVGASQDDTGGIDRGAVHVLFLNSSGTVKSRQKIAHNLGGGPSLSNSDVFGSSITAIGDLNGDGFTDLAVGAARDDTGGSNRGAVYVLFMNAGGTVNFTQKVASGFAGGPILDNDDHFGSSLVHPGDLNGDGVRDLLVGAPDDDTGGANRGAVYALYLNNDGTVKSHVQIASGTAGGPLLTNDERFGSAVASLGDLDQDGFVDLLVGAPQNDTGGTDRGATYVLFLDRLNTNPVFTSPNTVDVPENETAVITVTATDAEAPPQTVQFSIVGGVDASLFSITPEGVLSFNTGRNFEFPTGSNRDNLYEVTVQASDGEGGTATQNISVNITPVNEFAPTFTTPTLLPVPENSTFVTTFTGIDGDLPAPVLTYSLNNEFFDSEFFTLTSGGQLSFKSPPDFEMPLDDMQDNFYILSARISDGEKTTDQAFVVQVTPVNDNSPQFISPIEVEAIEDSTFVTNVVATDADLPQQTISYSIAGGADQGKFSITPEGLLEFISPPDFDVPGDANGDNVYVVTVAANDGLGGSNTQTINVSLIPNLDFGDAPDNSAGTGSGNYQTREADNGPRHTIVNGLRLGANADVDNGLLQNLAANADDVDGGLPKDEDGLSNAAIELTLARGTSPEVNVWVTNTTGSTATLYGWIDYNSDGVFDNLAERASVQVPSGGGPTIATLNFPSVLSPFIGTTYARFRLSTDPAAANPTGFAFNGEVEDHLVTITSLSDGTADPTATKKLASGLNNTPPLQDADLFGRAAEPLGDLDGDGVFDVAIGAIGDGTGGAGSGAVHILFMNADGSVKSSTKIADETSGGPALAGFDRFGISIATLGDLDADGVVDIAVGAIGDDSGGPNRGAVYVLFLNTDGTVKNFQKIANGVGGGPALADLDFFGTALTAVGDFNGDGVTDLAVGADGDDTGGSTRGAVHLLYLNADGTVQSSQKIASGVNGGPVLTNDDKFGHSVAAPGDLDGDGVTDLVVGATGDDASGSNAGAMYTLLMNQDGTVKSFQKIASGIGGGPVLAPGDAFGEAAASLGDLDGNGVVDIAVGAAFDDTDGANKGALYILFMNQDGTVLASQKIASGVGGGPTLTAPDEFGAAVAPVGDLNGDGVIEIVVGAANDATGGFDRAAAYVLFLNELNTNPVFTSPTSVSVAENVTAVQTVTAFDLGAPPQTLTFSIVGGVDQGRFSITETGQLSFVSAPDYEMPLDANTDNVYFVTVQASDGEGGTAMQTISVTVTPVNDNNPVFTSANTAVVPENTSTVLTVNAVDADLPAQAVNLNIVGGADQARFALSGGGVLSFVSSPNFELPTDANGDNVYVVVVEATDGAGGVTQQAINVTVAPVNDNDPVFTSPTNVEVPERTTIVLGVTASDGDLPKQALTFSLVGGNDQEDFFITPAGELSFVSPPAFLMPVDANEDNIYEVVVQVSDGLGGVTTQSISVSVVSATDFGDAPDLDAGTSMGNYRTRSADNGPSHYIVAGLRLGASVDGDDGSLQNTTTSADDVDGALPDDEDGVVYAQGDFVLTVGTEPTVNLWATNTTGTAATLYAWIDYNQDGEFDNAGERASVTVPAGVSNEIVTITLPTVPLDATGSTYARFRLSTDAAAANPFGVATDGEVEDHQVKIIRPSDGTVAPDKTVLIGPGPAIVPSYNDLFDISNGVTILAHSPLTPLASPNRIEDLIGGGANTATHDWGIHFGDNEGAGFRHFITLETPEPVTVRAIGVHAAHDPPRGWFGRGFSTFELWGDGELAYKFDTANPYGNIDTPIDSVVNADRFPAGLSIVNDLPTPKTASTWQAIFVQPGDLYRGHANGPRVSEIDAFGTSMVQDNHYFGTAAEDIGDLDGDGVTDLAVGAVGDDTGGFRTGAVHVLFLNPDGTVKSRTKIAHNTGGGPSLASGDDFGRSIAALGDLDGDGVLDLAVGANGDNTGGSDRGATYVLFMNPDGTAKSVQKIASGLNGAPTLANQDRFGWGVTPLGDFDGDGVVDMAVGSLTDSTGGANRGAVHLLFMNPDGTVKSFQKIASGVGGGPSLSNADLFGRSLRAISDLNGDGITELVVGAVADDTNGPDRGAAYVLFMNPDGTVASFTKFASDTNGGPTLADGDSFGFSIDAVGDLDGDGVPDLAVGAAGDDSGGLDRGAVHLLYLQPDGTVKATQKIASELAGGPTLPDGGNFGSAVTSLGDLDGDGVIELAVGSELSSATGLNHGSVHVLSLNKVNSPPEFTSPDTVMVAENSSAVLTVTATDTDLPPQTVTFSIVGGADQAKFSIADTGELSFLNPPDFEIPTDADLDNTYEVLVEANDGDGGTATQSITVLVTPVNDGLPEFTSPDMVDVAENNTTIVQLSATDSDLPAQNVSFSIVEELDSSFFSINSTGLVSFQEAPDFESPADADGDNVYHVTIEASDGAGGVRTQTIAVTVTPVNDNSPIFTSPDSVTVAENATTVLSVMATDADLPAQSLAYSIVGGADQAKFSISSTGDLTLKAGLDFEMPTDANGDGTYVVIVQASDGFTPSFQAILVTVSPVNDNNPVFTSPAEIDVDENTTDVLNVAATDADLPTQQVTFSIVGGDDQDRFSISTSGALAFTEAPDFETPADLNGDNVYEVTVQAADGRGGTTTQAILVSVRNVEEPLPGDYNNDGRVNLADYTVWRDTLGQSRLPFSGADGDGSGLVDQNDYAVWKSNFGAVAPSTLATSATATLVTEDEAPQADTQALSLPSIKSSEMPNRFIELASPSARREAFRTASRLGIPATIDGDDLLLLRRGRLAGRDPGEAQSSLAALDSAFEEKCESEEGAVDELDRLVAGLL